MEASSLYTNQTGGTIGGGSLTKSAMRGLFAKVPGPLEFGISNAGLEASRFHARHFSSLPPPVPPVIRPFSIFKLLASHHSQQQTRSIDFDDLDRKKSTGRTLARVS